MARIEVATEIPAPPGLVWAQIAEVTTHGEWMADAEEIRLTSPPPVGAGTTFDCDTRVGPLRLTDRMEITEWVPPRAMGVRHTGLVTGEGRFTLEPRGADRTHFTWQEVLRFPWWSGGPVAAWVAAPVLRRVWRSNLARLRARF